MDVAFLGGANGVGASCIAICIQGRWIVVDAGIRMTQSLDRLPDLSFLEQRDVAAIIVTHAHGDHIGALPLLHSAFPRTPVYASRATLQLMRLMLRDALSVMERHAAEDARVPLFDERAVTSMLRMTHALPVGVPCLLPQLPGVAVCAGRAGHVAGAISLGLASAEGSMIVSGDVSLTPQRTVLPAALPQLRRPGLLVLESTYGARRLHPNRQAEEARLADAVAQVISRGGHVLIPAFALGRAQEVLLILREAQRAGQIPLFPIYVDGLTRSVCEQYVRFPEALTPALQAQIQRGEDPFFGPNVRPVTSPEQRQAVLNGSPACIVSSSGMLTGGPSVFYASRLVERPEAAIYISGHLDEESPGRSLLDAAERKSSVLWIGGRRATVRCSIATYALSAHADASELSALVQAVQPERVALVHGDEPARVALAETLRARGHHVDLPRDGTVVQLRPARESQQRVPYTLPRTHRSGVLGDEPIALVDTEQFFAEEGAGSELPGVPEDAPTTPAGMAELLAPLLPEGVALVDMPVLHFASRIVQVRCRGRVTNDRLLRAAAAFADRTGWYLRVDLLDAAQPLNYDAARRVALTTLDGLIAEVSADRMRPHTMVLRFPLPDLVRAQHDDLLRAVQEHTRWDVVVLPDTHRDALIKALPRQLHVVGQPQIRHAERIVTVQSSRPLKRHTRRQYRDQFARSTGGWQLTILAPSPQV